MALTPIFWTNALKKYGSRGLRLALVLAFVVSIIFYTIYYYVIPEFFELSGVVEVILGFLMSMLALVLFFVLYWKLIVKKK